MLRRTTALLTGALLALGLFAGPALADHEHTLALPNGNAVTMPCEPAHISEDPHPIHYGLHMALDLRERPGWEEHPAGIEVSTVPECPTE